MYQGSINGGEKLTDVLRKHGTLLKKTILDDPLVSTFAEACQNSLGTFTRPPKIFFALKKYPCPCVTVIQ